MHLHGAKLGDLVSSKQSWTHFWKDIDTFEGGARGRGSGGAHSVTGAELDSGPLPQDVQAHRNASDKLVKSLQNQLAQSKRNAAQGSKRPSADADSGDSAKPGKGGGKRFRGGGRKSRKVTVKTKK